MIGDLYIDQGKFKNTDKTYFDGVNMGINWSKAVFKKFDFVIQKPSPEFNAFTLTGQLFFTFKGKEFSMSLANGYTFTENNRWKGFHFDSIIDCAKDEVIAQDLKKSAEEAAAAEKKKQAADKK